MPIKETLSDGTFYFVDTETGEMHIFSGITEVDVAQKAQNLITEEEKESSDRFKWGDSYTAEFSIKNFSMRDAYLKCLEDGVDAIWVPVPNNFRRMHGYRARRLSLRKRRAAQKLKTVWKKQKAQ